MSVSKALIVNALESRYDYYSARNVLKDALRVSGLEEKDNYSGAEVTALIEAFAEVGDRVETVLARLQPHASSEGAPKKAPTKKAAAEEAPAEAPAKTAEATEAKPAKKKAAKKKAPAKKAAKKK